MRVGGYAEFVKYVLLTENFFHDDEIKYFLNKSSRLKTDDGEDRSSWSESDWVLALKDGDVDLSMVPEQERSYKVCMAAVMADGDNLLYVPADLKSYRLVYAALFKSDVRTNLKNPSVNAAVPPEQWIDVVKNYPGEEPILKYVPAEVVSYKLCLAAVESCPENIADVPYEWRTKELCLAALRGDWSGLEVDGHESCDTAMAFVPWPVRVEPQVMRHTDFWKRDALGFELAKNSLDELVRVALKKLEERANIEAQVPGSVISVIGFKQNLLSCVMAPYVSGADMGSRDSKSVWAAMLSASPVFREAYEYCSNIKIYAQKEYLKKGYEAIIKEAEAAEFKKD